MTCWLKFQSKGNKLKSFINSSHVKMSKKKTLSSIRTKYSRNFRAKELIQSVKYYQKISVQSSYHY